MENNSHSENTFHSEMRKKKILNILWINEENSSENVIWGVTSVLVFCFVSFGILFVCLILVYYSVAL